MQLYNLVLQTYAVVTLIAIAVYFVTRKHQEPVMGYLALMLIGSFISDAIVMADSYWIHTGRKISIVSNAYGLVEIVTVMILYRMKLSPDKNLPFMILALALIAMQIVELTVFRDIFSFPGTTRAAFAIAVTILGLMYFFKMIMDLPAVHIYSIPMFWINSGMLVYFTGNFFLFMIEYYLVSVLKNNMIYYWSFHNAMGIISYVMIAVGLWTAKKQAPGIQTR